MGEDCLVEVVEEGGVVEQGGGEGEREEDG